MEETQIPGFTADGSLGLFFRTHNRMQRENGRINVTPTMMGGGCCGGFCDRPCRAGECKNRPGECCCAVD